MDLLKVYFSHAAQKVSPINYLIIAKWSKKQLCFDYILGLAFI